MADQHFPAKWQKISGGMAVILKDHSLTFFGKKFIQTGFQPIFKPKIPVGIHPLNAARPSDACLNRAASCIADGCLNRIPRAVGNNPDCRRTMRGQAGQQRRRQSGTAIDEDCDGGRLWQNVRVGGCYCHVGVVLPVCERQAGKKRFPRTKEALRLRLFMWSPTRKKIRRMLLTSARKRGFLGRSGPLRGVASLEEWLTSNPLQGRFLFRRPAWLQPCRLPLNQEMFRDANFERLREGIPHAEIFLAEIQKGAVSGPSVGVITPDRFLLREVSLEFGHAAEDHGAMRKFFFPKPKHLRGTWVLLAVTGGNTFYHHLLEALPKYHLLELAGIDPRRIDGWIINGQRAAFQTDTWKALGLEAKKLVTLNRRSFFQADRLIVPSLPSYPGHTPPWVVDFLRKLFDSKAKPGETGESLWISRRKASTRRFLKEKAWLEKLTPFGFREVFCEDLTLQEQAKVFAGAGHVAGAHGAGMANLVFSRNGTTVTEFFNPRYVNTCYWTLANSAGLKYAYFFGSKQPGDRPANHGDARGDIGLRGEASQAAYDWMRKAHSA